MYAYINGTVDEVAIDRAVLEAGGVGYELLCSQKTLKQLIVGQEVRLYTHLHLGDGIMMLYGFADTAEREMFRHLITVTRVGPRIAMSALSVLSVSDIISAVLMENAAAFDKIPGLGKKTAARVILELKEKLGAMDAITPFHGANVPITPSNVRQEAICALVSLGYDGVTAGRAVAAVPDCDRVEDMITSALKKMVGKIE